MDHKVRRLPATILATVGWLAVSILPSYAQSVNYSYDDLNRLTWIDYGDWVIGYTYDDVGNRVREVIRPPLITTASPPGGVYKAPLSVTLTCMDPQGPGCDKIYYTTDGTTPTPSSQIYSSPIAISSATTLRFFSRDLSGFSERVKSQTYTLALVGDVNGDGRVDCADLAIMKGSFGKKCGQTGFNSWADLNGDCVVDIRDLAAVSRQLPVGTRCP